MAGGEDTAREDRTEEPSERRLREAIEKGDVPRSADVNSVFILGAFALFIGMAASQAGSFMALGRGFIDGVGRVGLRGEDVLRASTEFLTGALLLALVPAGLFFAAALGGGLIQHRPVFSIDAVMPQLSRLSPLQGFERIFGHRARAHAVKGFFRVLLLGAALFFAAWPLRAFLAATTGSAAALLPGLIQDVLLRVMLTSLILYAGFAVLDYLHEYHEWRSKLRMTKEEVKEEHKSDEGNPEIKAKRRQLGRSRVGKRMMAAVPGATVVIANPTHFAVALRYEAGMDAPVCVAKGLDHLALRIRALAEDNRVPVIENPPLARTLYASVDLDEPIPVEHYRAVAEIIGFVLRLKRRRAGATLKTMTR